jgi:hypothetical protein
MAQRRAAASLRCGAHEPLPFWRIARPPIITTSTISVPWITCA